MLKTLAEWVGGIDRHTLLLPPLTTNGLQRGNSEGEQPLRPTAEERPAHQGLWQ